jgi:hypothetical protein
VETEKSLGRTDPAQISALVGYAGGQVGCDSFLHVPAGSPVVLRCTTLRMLLESAFINSQAKKTPITYRG